MMIMLDPIEPGHPPTIVNSGCIAAIDHDDYRYNRYVVSLAGGARRWVSEAQVRDLLSAVFDGDPVRIDQFIDASNAAVQATYINNEC